jgi:hypothetical protein
MLARSPIDPKRLLETAFPEDQIDYSGAARFLVELAAYFSVPVDRLRLEDRFAKELASRRGWEYDDELGIIEDFIVRVVRQRTIEIDPQKLFTIRDCVVALFARTGS